MQSSITHSMNAKSGMTLLESTVVILALLSIISLLFVWARALQKGSDRSANIMNIRNAQQAMRGHAGMNEMMCNGVLVESDIYGSTGYLKKPIPPNANITSYSGIGIVPETGTLWLNVTYSNTGSADYSPEPTLYEDW